MDHQRMIDSEVRDFLDGRNVSTDKISNREANWLYVQQCVAGMHNQDSSIHGGKIVKLVTR